MYVGTYVLGVCVCVCVCVVCVCPPQKLSMSVRSWMQDSSSMEERREASLAAQLCRLLLRGASGAGGAEWDFWGVSIRDWEPATE